MAVFLSYRNMYYVKQPKTATVVKKSHITKFIILQTSSVTILPYDHNHILYVLVDTFYKVHS